METCSGRVGVEVEESRPGGDVPLPSMGRATDEGRILTLSLSLSLSLSVFLLLVSAQKSPEAGQSLEDMPAHTEVLQSGRQIVRQHQI